MAKKKKRAYDPVQDVSGGLKEMYKDYFLDYASYVILERAVPAIEDGLKPVQRRILHSMRDMEDGRYHKVANIIGHSMQYHPHGDAAIGDALVNLGQKDTLIDTQGNWGDMRTGDSAAAPRYIEARLTKFALEVAFNPDLTEWQLSYDGRKQEPVTLPMKFPLILLQGVEGIAVGLSTRIMPHNFKELLEASINILRQKNFRIYPDFQTGGSVDVSEYNKGKRGGRIKVRATIEKMDNKTLAIRELPYGVTTGNMIDSILKANDKGKIKIKRVVDNTAKDVEILVDLSPGYSPDIAIDALFAFTNCEVSISPNACLIVDDKPHFLDVHEILKISTFRTRDLLKQELEIRENELEDKWHFSSLEKIFIQERIYRAIEECESWEEVLQVVREGLMDYVATPDFPKPKKEKKLTLKKEITDDNIARLTEIRIKRISKYNVFKAQEAIDKLVEELEEVRHHLKNLTDYTVAWFENLLEKYGADRERRTEIRSFDEIEAQQVVAANAKLYVNRKEGFIGTGLKKSEFVTDCSDMDDIIALRKDGKMVVTRISDKAFVGKDILHVGVWKRGDERTTYNLIYVDGKSGASRAKRFHVKAVTRDREYDLTAGTKGSRILYLTSNPNGEAEVVKVQLSQGCRARKKVFEFDFGELDIKGRRSKGNILTKYPIQKITLLEAGKSTLGARKFWLDEVSGKLNVDERGKYMGGFDTGDEIIAIYSDGSYLMCEPEENKRIETKKLMYAGKYREDDVISAVYYDGHKRWSVVKRFQVETQTHDQRFTFITESPGSELLFVSLEEEPLIQYAYTSKGDRIVEQENLADFIDLKGWKALGNKLSEYKVKIREITEDSEDEDEAEDEAKDKDKDKDKDKGKKKKRKDGSYKAGDTIDFDLSDEKGKNNGNGNGQTSMFDED